MDIPKTLIDASVPFLKDIEPENLTGNFICNKKKLFFSNLSIQTPPPEPEIIKKASDLMTTLSSLNKGIEVIHPGNCTNYYQQPVEFGASLKDSMYTYP